MLEMALGRGDERVRKLTKLWATGLCERADIEVEVFGCDLVDWSAPVIIMANHQSYLDVLALYRTMPTPFGIIAKQMLFRVPAFGGVMRALGCVPVDRGNRKKAVASLQAAARQIQAGSTIAVFPEGTRTDGKRITRLKKGPFHLVQEAQVPIIPVGIRGTAALMPRANTALYSGRIEVHLGPPIAPPTSGEEARAQSMAEVRSALAALAELPERDE